MSISVGRRGRASEPLLAAVALAGITGCLQPEVAPMVAVGDHALEAVVKGRGTPAVIFEAGFNGGSSALHALQVEVAKTTRTVAYSRAGLGRSDEGPGPRSSVRIAAELKTLITALEIEEPVIVVGHSVGGMFARVFASRYPDDVAGVILVDPATEDSYEHWRSTDPAHWEQFEEEARTTFKPRPGWYGQWQALPQSLQEVRASGPLPPRPVVVLSALVPYPGEWMLADPERIALWVEAHERLVQRTPNATHVVLEHVNHVEIASDPAVVDAIEQMIEQIRTR